MYCHKQTQFDMHIAPWLGCECVFFLYVDTKTKYMININIMDSIVIGPDLMGEIWYTRDNITLVDLYP
jgi:hypothetical protein